MQVNLPEKVYGIASYHMPRSIYDWLVSRNLRYESAGSYKYADGYEHVVIIHNASSEDATAFKLYFPDCKVYA